MTKTEFSKVRSSITVKKDMRDYSNDPYFVKKADQASAFFKKNGLPKEFKRKDK